MSPWGNICRICASPAKYDVFATIPIYLHADCKEYLAWPTPINVMIEQTTGLKVSSDDGLPEKICALCISYLKHAKTFREQTINTYLNFLAVQTYKNIANGKEVWDYDDIEFTPGFVSRDDDNLKDNQSREQNKVFKNLLSNTIINSTPYLSKQIKDSLKYLNKLYDDKVRREKRPNGAHKPTTKQRKHLNQSIDSPKPSTSGCNSKTQNLEDDLASTTSSEDCETPEEAALGSNKTDLLSYKEKTFEEDDIMDLNEIKEVIDIKTPATLKEHKCSYCFKRFMFIESYNEHIKTCIEYRFATFSEEMNNLLSIRQSKEMSPHEFIRRMIFSFRKTCEWLKENCIDDSLPDLLQNNKTTDTLLDKQHTEAVSKSTGSRFKEQLSHESHHMALLSATPLAPTKPTVECNNTAITTSNNILYEIERSQSGNSQTMNLKKPIPVLATANVIKTVDNCSSPNPEGLTLMEKLQNAAKQMAAENFSAISPNISTPKRSLLQSESNFNNSPLISVRKDLLAQNGYAKISSNYASPLQGLFQSPYPRYPSAPAPIPSPCARCPQCNIYFERLEDFEIHNARQHNPIPASPYQINDEQDMEYKKNIIALFDDDDAYK